MTEAEWACQPPKYLLAFPVSFDLTADKSCSPFRTLNRARQERPRRRGGNGFLQSWVLPAALPLGRPCLHPCEHTNVTGFSITKLTSAARPWPARPFTQRLRCAPCSPLPPARRVPCPLPLAPLCTSCPFLLAELVREASPPPGTPAPHSSAPAASGCQRRAYRGPSSLTSQDLRPLGSAEGPSSASALGQGTGGWASLVSLNMPGGLGAGQPPSAQCL